MDLVMCGCCDSQGVADLDCWDCGGSGVVRVDLEAEDGGVEIEIEESAGMEPVAGAAGAPEI
jgi:hypothetical protein